MSFRTMYNRQRVPSNVGQRVIPTYRAAIDADGRLDLIESGKVDLYSEIQSHKDSVDLDLILERFANGDVSALGQPRPAVYMDVTEFPKTYAEMWQLMLDAKAEFMKLPLDVREQFDHSPERYFTMFGSPEFNRIMGIESAVTAENTPPVAEKTVENSEVI